MSSDAVNFRDLAGRLKKAKISMYISIPAPGGFQPVFIEAEKLEAVLNDRDAFIARHFGVTKDHYLLWIEFIRNPQCMATTRKGRQCRSSYWGAESEFNSPDKFDPNRNYFCHSHQEYAETFKDFKKRA